MKLIVILLACFGNITAKLLTLEQTLRVKDHAFNRLKRQINLGESYQQTFGNRAGKDNNDLFCPLQCFGIAINAAMASKDIPTDPFRANGQYYTQADQQKFRDACKTYQEMKNCWRPCPKSFLTDLTASTYETMDYLCGPNFEEWNQYMPCYLSTADEIAGTCAQKCQNYTQALTQQMNNMGNSFSNNMNYNNYQMNSNQMNSNMGTFSDTMTQILDGSCQYIKCSTECERPQLVQKCGERAASLLEGLVSVSINSLGQIVNFENGLGTSNSGFTGSNNVYPNNQFGFQQQTNSKPKLPTSCTQIIQQYNPSG